MPRVWREAAAGGCCYAEDGGSFAWEFVPACCGLDVGCGDGCDTGSF